MSERVVPAPGAPDSHAAKARPGRKSDRRRPRAPHPLWSPDAEREKRETFEHVRAILDLANRDFGASFDVERSRRDTLLYPYEVVRGAVANVLLKQARGYRFENPGAVLWDAITLPDYRLEEFAVANLDEVLARCGGTFAPLPASAPTPFGPSAAETSEAPGKPEAARVSPDEDRERQRAQTLRDLWDGLPAEVRTDLERRARAIAGECFVGRGGPLEEAVLALRALRIRDELLEREYGSASSVRSESG